MSEAGFQVQFRPQTQKYSFGAELLLGVGDTTHFRGPFSVRQFCMHEI